MLGELTRLRAELGLDACVHLTRGLPAEGIHERLRRADVFVLASRTEALSLALLEAMSHGLAIVATAVGGIPEFIRDGETGLLAPPESVDALADAMGRLLADEALRARLGENARKHLEASTFSEACCLERVLASYDRARNLAAAR
jgi:glycosyltransferase involved in cell wall biosynthesis